jgi:hypothetical protein
MYMRGKLCFKTEFEDGSVSFSEAFDPDDPSLIDRHPEYDTDTHLGDRPPAPNQQRDERYKLKWYFVGVNCLPVIVHVVLHLSRSLSSLYYYGWFVEDLVVTVLLVSLCCFIYLGVTIFCLCVSVYLSVTNGFVELVGLLKHAGVDGENYLGIYRLLPAQYQSSWFGSRLRNPCKNWNVWLLCTLPKTIIDPRLFNEMFLKSWNSTKMRISRRIPYTLNENIDI